jgi:hypothetical protein
MMREQQVIEQRCTTATSALNTTSFNMGDSFQHKSSF